MYHEVSTHKGDPIRDIVPGLAASMLEAQLEYLRRHYNVVPLQELRERVRGREPGDRVPVALTFDDDLSSHEAIAAPLLASAEFPATFFLTGSSLHGRFTFWWQDLQAVANQGRDSLARLGHEIQGTWAWARLDGDVHDLFHTIEQMPPDDRDAIASRLRELSGSHPEDGGLPAVVVRRLVDRGFEIGFHTRHHYSLPMVDANGLHRAMREGLDELEAVIGYRPTAIAYPYCRADLRVAHAAKEAGFKLGFVCGDIPIGPDQHPLLLPRVNAWSHSLGGFAWKLASVAAQG